MVWVVKLEEVIEGEVVSCRKVMALDRPEHLESLEDLGLRLEDGKAFLAELQALVVARQFERDQERRAACAGCGSRQRIKDYRLRHFDTVFGRVSVRRPRFECVRCNHQGCTKRTAAGLCGRSTPEFDALRAKLAAHLPYRVARDLLCEMLPVSGGVAHTTIRGHTFAVADQIGHRLSEAASNGGKSPVASLTLGLDTAYIRALPGHPTRHVLVGHVQRDDGVQRYFAGVESQPTLIRTRLNQLGYRENTKLTVLSDGEDGLRSFALAATGAPIRPILDWFHIAMRVQHLKQLARGLSTRGPTHAAATAKIRDELERLHWRLWHGRTNAVDVSIRRLSKAIGAFRRYRTKRKAREASRKLWVMLYDLKRYVRGNANIIVNYHRRQRSGQAVSTSLVESAVNHLVNRRMNKSQQMRWSTHGAHQLLQVRAAIINGEFEQLVATPSAESTADDKISLPLAA